MTIRLLGIPDELRLEIEQNSPGVTTEAARLIIENAVQQAQTATEETIADYVKEVQSVVGPHGSLSRIQIGGIRVTPGLGIGVYADGVFKTNIQPNGTLVIGSNIENPETTTELFFVEDTVYNNEIFHAGDFLIGDNSAGVQNLKYNAIDGRLEFRIGQTVSIIQDAEGALTFSNNVTGLSFLSTDPLKTAYLKMTDLDDFWMVNSVASHAIRLNVRTTDNNPYSMVWGEDGSNANVTQLKLFAGADGGTISMGGITLWTSKDGKETVLNDDSFDVDFRIESATHASAFKLDAGGEFIQIFGGDLATFDNSSEHRLEIGADHYFPTRNSSDKTVYLNEANEDIDTKIRSTGDDNMFVVDAGLDGIGVAGAAESGYKLKITGNVKITDGLTWDGWQKDPDTWTRTGNHTYTKSGDHTATHRKGAKIRYKDGGSYEYGVIGSSSHAAGTTTINLIPNSDYAMAAATITDTYLSYIENPEGWPHWFNYTATFSRSGTAFTNSPTVNKAHFKAQGDMIIGYIDFTMPASAGGTGEIYATAPATIVTDRMDVGFESTFTAKEVMCFAQASINKLNFYNDDPAVILTTSGYRYRVNFKYLF